LSAAGAVSTAIGVLGGGADTVKEGVAVAKSRTELLLATSKVFAGVSWFVSVDD
jgi:hypothetical protein